MTTFADECWRDRNWLVKDVAHLEPRPALPPTAPSFARQPTSVAAGFASRWRFAQRELLRGMRTHRRYLDGLPTIGGAFIPRHGWLALWKQAKAQAWDDAVRQHARECLLLGVEPSIPDSIPAALEPACL